MPNTVHSEIGREELDFTYYPVRVTDEWKRIERERTILIDALVRIANFGRVNPCKDIAEEALSLCGVEYEQLT